MVRLLSMKIHCKNLVTGSWLFLVKVWTVCCSSSVKGGFSQKWLQIMFKTTWRNKVRIIFWLIRYLTILSVASLICVSLFRGYFQVSDSNVKLGDVLAPNFTSYVEFISEIKLILSSPLQSFSFLFVCVFLSINITI